ncbi:flavodoxin family protein [Salidesulfovibrio onnuriiensis]|uniref:flavodoxin family protein n=1 Tax=Salidesulfovibrio onnuriiensis TaxID=2583823 RepID=UPI0011C8DAA2|nr:hypothetical protein [Salidesulfovibrio onnuriiensis]
MNILNLYASLNGQTEKVALEIERACADAGCDVKTINVGKQDLELDLLRNDLTFMGSGVYTWLPGKRMLKWIDRQLASARDRNLILPGSPRLPGKFACVYCTYAGPHTGEAEATPAIKYMGQLFDHLGVTVADEWAIPGAFVPENKRHLNTSGRLGNIEGRPNEHDLMQVRERARGLIESLRSPAANESLR